MAPSQDSSHHQDYDIFSKGIPINLHLPLLLGGGHTQDTLTTHQFFAAGFSGRLFLNLRGWKVEGVCRWLEEAITKYCKQRGFPRASFINAGGVRKRYTRITGRFLQCTAAQSLTSFGVLPLLLVAGGALHTSRRWTTRTSIAGL